MVTVRSIPPDLLDAAILLRACTELVGRPSTDIANPHGEGQMSTLDRVIRAHGVE